MKFILILTLCSSINNSCMPPVSIDELYQSHYDCVYDGYKISGETLVTFGQDKVNQERFYIKFICKEVQKT